MVQENLLADCLPEIWLSVVALAVIGLLVLISRVLHIARVFSGFDLSSGTSDLLLVGTRPTAATFGKKILGGSQQPGLVWFLSNVMGLFAECAARLFLVPAVSLKLATSPWGTVSARVKFEAIQAERCRALRGTSRNSIAWR